MKVWALVSSLMLAAASIGAVRARLQQPAAPPRSPEPTLQLTPSEIEIYKRAQTLIDWTPSQIHDSPFLHKLRPTGSQDQLPMVLERVGRTGTLLFHDFPQVSCDEEVFSEMIFPARYSGIRHGANLHKFRYIVIPRPAGDFPAFEEYRTDLKGNHFDDSSSSDSFMITSGFASSWLYLSPANQPDNRFRHFGTQTIRNRKCHVVGFAQDPERVHSIAGLRMGGKSLVVLVQGLAWIDSQTFQVLRVITWLLAPRTDVGLRSQISTVDLYTVKLRGSERALWLPREVTVEVVYRGIEVRNTHHYSNFKLFRVESTIKPAG